MRTKRITAALLAAVTALSMASCADGDSSSKNETVTPASVSETVTAAPEDTGTVTEAATETEAAAVTEAAPEESAEEGFKVKGELEYWTEGSEIKDTIIDWVTAVTDPDSPRFIPVEDRIVVSDMDGTLIGELYPAYFDHCMFVHRALHDDSYQAPEDMKEFALQLEEAFQNRTLPKGIETVHAKFAAEAYKGMTVDELKEYTREYMKSEADGFENLTRGEAYYKPMKSLIDFLTANDFTVYVVSGTDRTLSRVLCEEMFGIPANRVIGTDTTIVGSGQGDTDGLDYLLAADDKVVYGGEFITKNLKMNKVSAIVHEIGKVPVLSLGNSSGDLSMSEYVYQNEKYDGRAYLLLCDDTERDYGKPEVAKSLAETCDQLGFYTVSMRDDFATIYGDGVKLTGKVEGKW